MNTQHTPGNWYAEGDVVFSDVGTRVADCACNENDEREMPDGEEEANAQLIASAPALIAALRRIAHENGSLTGSDCAEIAFAALDTVGRE